MSFAAANKSKQRAHQAKKAAALDAAPAIEIPPTKISPRAHDAQVVLIKDIRVLDKHDRVRDERFAASVRELAANIARNGLINPITVTRLEELILRKNGETLPKGTTVLIAGERRLEACKLLGWSEIPATVMVGSGISGLDVRAAENLHRLDLDEDVKAFTVGNMLSSEIDAACKSQDVKFEDLDAPAQDAVREAAVKATASRLGWPVPRVRDYAYVAELPEKVLSLARQGRLSMGHLRVLAQLPDPDRMVALAEAHAAGEDQLAEPACSVDELKRAVSQEQNRLAGVPWDLAVEFAGGPACNVCPHNSKNQTGLFEGEYSGLAPTGTSNFDLNKQHYRVTEKDLEAGICSRLACYRAKTAATKQAWRGPADRIAAKVAELKPAEREREAAKLLKEAADRCAFVRLTVFRKNAGERIKQRLESASPSGKAKAGMDRQVKADAGEARREAENKWWHAKRDYANTVGEQIAEAIDKLEPWRRLLFHALMGSSFSDAVGYQLGKPDRLKTFDVLARKVLSGESSSAALLDLAAALTDEELNLDACAESAAHLAKVVGLKDIPPVPTLQDFLPKKAEAAKAPAKKPAKKSKAKKAAVSAVEA